MNKKSVIIMQKFNHFFVSELFPNCSEGEILSCVNSHYVDSLLLLLGLLDNFREYACTPIKITSGFRGMFHNQTAGGVPTSQHLIGQAIDFKPLNMPFQTFEIMFREWVAIAPCRDLLGQIIIYPNFIHMALRCKSHKKLSIYDKRKH